MISYQVHDLDSDEDEFGGFTPVVTTLDEIYQPVCHSCTKDECGLLGYFILLFLFSGGAIGLGVFVFVFEIKQDANERFFLEFLTLLLVLSLAGISGVLMLCTVAGCVGTFTQNNKLLQVITIFLKLALIIEIVIFLLAVIYHTRVKTETNKFAEWMSFIHHYHEDPNLRFTLNSIQSTLRCCGFNGYKDWDENPLFSCSSPRFKTCRIPVSCCDSLKKNSRDCEYKIRHRYDGIIEREPEKFVHTRGCLAIIQDWYKYNLTFISISCILLAVVQVIIIVFLKRTVRRIRKENIKESSEIMEQERTPLREEVELTTNGKRNTKTSFVKAQGALNIKTALRAILGWRGRQLTATIQEMI